ncbi:hypothetical protein F4780DRAFT_100560 [Xylariomycetidae sp. FL0641]|nr:hypothetical protein F4780DRAFT_100560 [Xylariomycetidae sp. FL0641]
MSLLSRLGIVTLLPTSNAYLIPVRPRCCFFALPYHFAPGVACQIDPDAPIETDAVPNGPALKMQTMQIMTSNAGLPLPLLSSAFASTRDRDRSCVVGHLANSICWPTQPHYQMARKATGETDSPPGCPQT